MVGVANSLIILGVLSLISFGVSLPRTPSQQSKEDITGVCPEDFIGLLPHPSDCTLFYHCNKGQIALKSCPGNLHFNPASSTCDWPWNVPQCGQGTTKPPTEATTTKPPTEATTTKPPTEATTTTTERPAPPETEICRPGFFGYQNLPGNCNYYVLCADGTAILRKCESGASFNIADATCKDSNLVEGCESVEPTTTTQATTTLSTSTAVPITTTRATETPTTTTTTTQRTTTRAPPTTTTTQRTTTTAAPGQFPCPPEDFIYMPHPSDCNKFYLCRHGSFVSVYNCGLNLWFNYSRQVCQNPWGSSCR